MCTGIRIKSKTGDYFWGRTMDLSFPMFGDDTGMPAAMNNLVVVTTVPAGIEVPSEATPWTSKYTTIGMGVKNTPVLFDGINEKGLAGDTQVLMEADYGSAADIAARKQTALLAEEFVTFVLTQYSTVAEIKADYEKFALVNEPYKALGQSISMTLHFSFVDPTGDGIVLEPVNDGAFKACQSIADRLDRRGLLDSFCCAFLEDADRIRDGCQIRRQTIPFPVTE